MCSGWRRKVSAELDYRSALMMQATDTMAITFGKADAVNTPPPKGGGFRLRLKAGLVGPMGRLVPILEIHARGFLVLTAW